MFGHQWRGQHEANVPLLEDIARMVANAGFEAGVARDLKAEGRAIIIGGLLGVAYDKANVVDGTERKKIFFFRARGWVWCG